MFLLFSVYLMLMLVVKNRGQNFIKSNKMYAVILRLNGRRHIVMYAVEFQAVTAAHSSAHSAAKSAYCGFHASYASQPLTASYSAADENHGPLMSP